jgi:hypothetical protein
VVTLPSSPAQTVWSGYNRCQLRLVAHLPGQCKCRLGQLASLPDSVSLLVLTQNIRLPMLSLLCYTLAQGYGQSGGKACGILPDRWG